MQRPGGAAGWTPGPAAGGPGEPPHFAADEAQLQGEQAADGEVDEGPLEGEEDPVKVGALPLPAPPPTRRPTAASVPACRRCVPACPPARLPPFLPQVVVRVRPPLPRELHGFRPFENAVLVDPAHQLITLSENLAALSNGGVENGIVSGTWFWKRAGRQDAQWQCCPPECSCHHALRPHVVLLTIAAPLPACLVYLAGVQQLPLRL